MIAYCPSSKFRCKAEQSPLRCPLTGAPLEFTDMPLFDPASIEPKVGGMWRYEAMLPVVHNGYERITLGEGWTPLIPDRWAGRSLYWKLDALMPTGSYKDRGVCVMVNWLRGLGYEALADDTSGNAGASLACYAGRAGLRGGHFRSRQRTGPQKGADHGVRRRTGRSARHAPMRRTPSRRRPATAARWPTPLTHGILRSFWGR